LAESSEQAKQSKQKKLGGIERYKQSSKQVSSKHNIYTSSSELLLSWSDCLWRLLFFCFCLHRGISCFRFYYSFVIRILETEKIAFVGVLFDGTVKLGGIEQAKLLVISSNHIYFLSE